jgi:hypothetical protein
MVNAIVYQRTALKVCKPVKSSKLDLELIIFASPFSNLISLENTAKTINQLIWKGF